MRKLRMANFRWTNYLQDHGLEDDDRLPDARKSQRRGLLRHGEIVKQTQHP